MARNGQHCIAIPKTVGVMRYRRTPMFHYGMLLILYKGIVWDEMIRKKEPLSIGR